MIKTIKKYYIVLKQTVIKLSSGIYIYIYTSFAVHNNFKSHIGITKTLGKYEITSVSVKHEVNAKWTKH